MAFVRLLVLLLFLPLACSMQQGMQMDPGASADNAQALSALQARTDLHVARMNAAPDRAAADAEVDAYVADLGPTMAAMTSTCASMMHAASGEDAADTADFMMDAVRSYQVAAHAASDLSSIRTLAAAHHAKLSAMIRYMRSMMSGMSMM